MIDSDLYIERLWKYFTFPAGGFMDKAKRHASRLKKMYYDVLQEMGVLSEDDLEDSFSLFLSSYFLDDAFDKIDRPYALAIGLHLYTEYFHKIGTKHPEMLDTLRKYYRLQMIYQSAERDTENEKGYDLSYVADPDNYHMKQVVLLFPLELSKDEDRDTVFRLFIHYFCCILLTDDIVDAEEDLESGTLNPLTCGCSSKADIPAARDKCAKLFEYHKNEIMEICSNEKFESSNLTKALEDFDSIVSVFLK